MCNRKEVNTVDDLKEVIKAVASILIAEVIIRISDALFPPKDK